MDLKKELEEITHEMINNLYLSPNICRSQYIRGPDNSNLILLCVANIWHYVYLFI
jgi:hypothetical protein